MYNSRGSGAYGQSYTGQPAYGQNLGANYSGASVGGHDVGQHSVAGRHSTILGASQEADAAGYRPHTSTAAQYGGQYSSVYGSASLNSAQQVPSMGIKAAASSALDSRGGYSLGVSDSPKFASGDYVPSSSHGYAHKSDQMYGDKGLDYSGIDRRQYGERQSAYTGRDIPSDLAGRYAADPVGFSHQHQQAEIYDRIDQAALLRQEQLLKAQSLQGASHDGGARQGDYLAARAAASRHPTQDLMSYGGRMDSDPRASSMLSAASYSGQHAPSILGAAPRRNVDDLLYSQNASNPGYGVSLPPGRDYASGKGLHGNAMELDYPGVDRKDDRASYLREFEQMEEERRRERLRERDRDREREKERERLQDRERERERERKRMLERREKEKAREKERERKRALETKKELTPVRSTKGPRSTSKDPRSTSKDPRSTSKGPRSTSKDPRASSLSKDGRSSRRDSPHRSTLHRHHSPVKEKRREYVCKVYSSCLVDIERDYLSLDKRYPRLFVTPEFSKAVVNWPKCNLELSIRTPVSFEHDFFEEASSTEPRDSSNKLLMGPATSSEPGNIVWNAKIILMSGLSRTALEELSSDKVLDDRVPHICNFLRFAVLKKDHAFSAVGGPWEPADGGDPSIDDNSLIRTALRYAKDGIQLDLQNCKHWNRFLEIHYDRIGKDGFFSHKEITVLYVPNLSDCLPSLEEWCNQWLAHKKAVAERERQYSLKKEKSRDTNEASKDKDSAATGKATDVKKKEKDSNNVKQETGTIDNKIAKIEGSDIAEEGKSAEKKQGETAIGQTTGSVKSVKKKIIRKVVKQKVVNKANHTTSKQMDKVGEKEGSEKMVTSNVPVLVDKASVDTPGVKISDKSIVAVAVSTGKSDGNEEKVNEINSSNDKQLEKPETTVAGGEATVKTTKKKKVIRRVPKKKVVGEASNSVVSAPGTDGGSAVAVQAQDSTQSISKQKSDADTTVNEVKKTVKVVAKKKLKTPTTAKQDNTPDSIKKESKSDKKDELNVVAIKEQNDTHSTGKSNADADTTVTEAKKTGKLVPKKKSKAPTSEKQDGVAVDPNTTEIKTGKEDKKDERATGEKSGAKTDKPKASQKDIKNGKGKLKDEDKSKDGKGTKERGGKDDPKSKSSKEVKEKRKSDEPPRHPGFIVRPKLTKDSKLRSLSLSLDALLDYTDKDVEDSTLELSLFAESFYEMLQFQMGSRILTFLQKLRTKFVIKRAQRKRPREDGDEKENVKKSSTKRQKGDEKDSVKSEPTNADASNPTQGDDEKREEKTVADNDNSSDKDADVKMEEGTDEEEDPEEDPEEYEEKEDGSPQHDSSTDKKNVEQDANVKVEPESMTSNEKATDETSKGETKVKEEVKEEAKSDAKINEEKEEKVDKSKKETPVKEVTVDRELLQAFQFFDRNRAGYIRVEDMRLVIHNLGMFLSHRDVKELVQSALLESNTGRDDRILYTKLVRMNDL
ncbi:PREDICTED: cell division cycle and apoptosis regulator protein 1 isoform X2 [Lupinus angustifolius]|uniref:cell division cycle and apoptosis regulator protein 1 isoform X2 n=1 Tax=Lupinus angustifolius TaxID=3871 RepID=UPI00092F0A62|nr:PREDICTED: cell division cycle and apoptosis regulator protein 1 isoform X2 [Lupinus angustifolius]